MNRHAQHGGPAGIRRFVRARLQRRLFVWFGVSIVAAGAAAAVVMWLVSQEGGGGWRREVERLEHFVSGRLALVWFSPQRDELAGAMARDLDLDVVLSDPNGALVSRFGPGPCERPAAAFPVTAGPGAPVVGHVAICLDRHRAQPWHLAVPLLFVGVMLWGAAGALARRLARPLDELARVAKDIGAGRLQSRANLHCRAPDEVGVVAVALNDMAARIEQQLQDQRTLLAAVSHELRTPLTRMRLLVELLRESNAAGAVRYDELEREIVAVDELVGELLAGARVDFSAVAPRPLDGVALARRALERAGLDAAVLVASAGTGAGAAPFEGDPTLLARALANLVDNARRHGGGLVALRVAARPGTVTFEADDAGPGLPPGDEARLFEPFHRRAADEEGTASGATRAGGTGLGLALVQRIAAAHGGHAYARNRPEGGATVGFEVAAAA